MLPKEAIKILTKVNKKFENMKINYIKLYQVKALLNLE